MPNEKKIFKVIFFLSMAMLIIGLFTAVSLQQKAIKLLVQENLLLREKQSILEGNNQTFDDNPEFFTEDDINKKSYSLM
jgi:hypothetical protein